MRQLDRNVAFTLIELLIVIAVVAVFVALLLFAVQKSLQSARRVAYANNLKQIGIALQVFHDTYRCFPVGSSPCKVCYG